jgi:transposase
LRDRLRFPEAIFWLAAHTLPGRAPPPWAALPPEFGKPDTVSRQFRRWAKQGLWTKLLRALADPDHPGITILRRLESWICRTYRRAWRLLGVQGMALPRISHER